MIREHFSNNHEWRHSRELKNDSNTFLLSFYESYDHFNNRMKNNAIYISSTTEQRRCKCDQSLWTSNEGLNLLAKSFLWLEIFDEYFYYFLIPQLINFNKIIVQLYFPIPINKKNGFEHEECIGKHVFNFNWPPV